MWNYDNSDKKSLKYNLIYILIFYNQLYFFRLKWYTNCQKRYFELVIMRKRFNFEKIVDQFVFFTVILVENYNILFGLEEKKG